MIKIKLLEDDSRYGDWKKGDIALVINAILGNDDRPYIVVHLLRSNRDVLVPALGNPMFKII